MRAVNILLVEDNEGDILLTTEAFEESIMISKITVVKDGEAAINFFETLRGNDVLPDLVLLDINLPKKSGHEVLHYIKNNIKYKQVPVIMLTTSSAAKDVIACYENYVNCYVTKPVDISDFIRTVIKIEDFWVNTATMPSK